MNNLSPELIGRVFGELTIVRLLGRDCHRNAIAFCRCNCGVEKELPVSALRTGRTRTCGCRLNRPVKHGHARKGKETREFYAWNHMIRRCEDPKDKNYKDYGERGIKVCERRHEFANFIEDMGSSHGLTLDRIDNNKGYNKENCKWSTRKEQTRNRRITQKISIGGITKPVAEWAEQSGIARKTILQRVEKGWPESKLLIPATKHPHLIEIGGVKKSIAEWAREFGIPNATAMHRFHRGAPAEEIFRKQQ